MTKEKINPTIKSIIFGIVLIWITIGTVILFEYLRNTFPIIAGILGVTFMGAIFGLLFMDR